MIDVTFGLHHLNNTETTEKHIQFDALQIRCIALRTISNAGITLLHAAQ